MSVVFSVLLGAAGSLAAGSLVGYLLSGSMILGCISGSCALLYHARVYIQGYYFDRVVSEKEDLTGWLEVLAPHLAPLNRPLRFMLPQRAMASDHYVKVDDLHHMPRLEQVA